MPVRSAAHSHTFEATMPSDREIRLTRLFDAPPELIFEALTTPEHIRQWWSILDDEHSVTECEMDPRPGGAWRFVGRGPRGEYAFYGVCREVTPPSRIVYTEFYAPFPDVESVVTAELTREGDKTRLTVTSRYPSTEVRDMVNSTGMANGAAISYDRLEDVVTALQGR